MKVKTIISLGNRLNMWSECERGAKDEDGEVVSLGHWEDNVALNNSMEIEKR